VAEKLKSKNRRCRIPDTAFADYPDISRHHSVAGDGPRSLVLIHELAGTLESFERVMPALEADFRILRGDQRGAGLSKKARASFSLNDLVADALALMQTAELKPPTMWPASRPVPRSRPHWLTFSKPSRRAGALRRQLGDQSGSQPLSVGALGACRARRHALNRRYGVRENRSEARLR
jgi:pimeloyl-ACP methyl ester carboxylesterase